MCAAASVLFPSHPQVAGCVIEFTGGPGAWHTRTYSGGRNLGSTGVCARACCLSWGLVCVQCVAEFCGV